MCSDHWKYLICRRPFLSRIVLRKYIINKSSSLGSNLGWTSFSRYHIWANRKTEISQLSKTVFGKHIDWKKTKTNIKKFLQIRSYNFVRILKLYKGQHKGRNCWVTWSFQVFLKTITFTNSKNRLKSSCKLLEKYWWRYYNIWVGKFYARLLVDYYSVLSPTLKIFFYSI